LKPIRIIRKPSVSAIDTGLFDFLRCWDERDTLNRKLYDASAHSGGILKISQRGAQALPEHNSRVMANMKGALLFPFLAWVEGRGLRHLRKAG
jgi:hypothetical protein